MMTVNLFTAVPAFATDDFSDVEVAVQEDSNEDAEEMEIQDILNRHPYDISGGQQQKVALAKMEKDFFDKKYEVIFANSSKVEFFKDGTWKEVDCKYSTVPEAVIPEAILRYVKATYPDHKVVKIEKEDRGYEAKLANGMKLEFDNKFNLIDIDN